MALKEAFYCCSSRYAKVAANRGVLYLPPPLPAMGVINYRLEKPIAKPSQTPSLPVEESFGQYRNCVDLVPNYGDYTDPEIGGLREATSHQFQME